MLIACLISFILGVMFTLVNFKYSNKVSKWLNKLKEDRSLSKAESLLAAQGYKPLSLEEVKALKREEIIGLAKIEADRSDKVNTRWLANMLGEYTVRQIQISSDNSEGEVTRLWFSLKKYICKTDVGIIIDEDIKKTGPVTFCRSEVINFRRSDELEDYYFVLIPHEHIEV